MPPGWLAVTEQLHLPLALFEQSALAHPRAVKMLPILAHGVATEEIVRHESARGNVRVPVVVVPSV
jgi:hypothetical protein